MHGIGIGTRLFIDNISSKDKKQVTSTPKQDANQLIFVYYYRLMTLDKIDADLQ